VDILYLEYMMMYIMDCVVLVNLVYKILYILSQNIVYPVC
jgi:hypothetical protein